MSGTKCGIREAMFTKEDSITYVHMHFANLPYFQSSKFLAYFNLVNWILNIPSSGKAYLGVERGLLSLANVLRSGKKCTPIRVCAKVM